MERPSFRFDQTASLIALCASASAAFAACAVASGPERATQSHAQAQSADAPLPERFERVLPWGAGDEQLRSKPALAESVAQGPNAVAVAPNGHVLILDRLAGRVVAVDHQSPPKHVASVATDVEDFAAGADGRLLAWSPLRARAWVLDGTGKNVGEIGVPRELRDAQSLELGVSHRVSVRTAYQERFAIGSPAAPLPLPVTLRTRREGAVELADGRGVSVRVDQGAARMLVLTQAADERSQVVAEHPIPGTVTAARVLGRAGDVVCARTEQVTSTPALAVSRRAVCLRIGTGAVVLDQALPAPGLYAPRTELAVGGGRLAFIHPTEQGLGVTSWRIAGAEVTP